MLVSNLIHAQGFLQRSLLFDKQPKQLFSSVLRAVSEEYFSLHISLSFILQYVGVIFNHNINFQVLLEFLLFRANCSS